MLSLFRSLSLRYLFQRWDRASLIVASIALGVATLVSTRILNNCIDSVVQQTTNPVALGDLQIANGELGFSQTIVKELEEAQIPGVQSMLPLVVDRIEAEAMQLQGYAPVDVIPWENASGGKAIECTQAQGCAATFRFAREAGWYELDVEYFDQNNGESRFRVSVVASA